MQYLGFPATFHFFSNSADKVCLSWFESVRYGSEHIWRPYSTLYFVRLLILYTFYSRSFSKSFILFGSLFFFFFFKSTAFNAFAHFFYSFLPRIRIKTEEKTKVVVSVWGEEFIQFLAALAALRRTTLKKRMN